MNLDRFLHETRFDSRGRFELTLDQWFDKVSQFQFSQPEHGVVAIVAAALRAGATTLEVSQEGSRVDYRLHLKVAELESLQGLLGALAASRGDTRRITLACPAHNRQFTLNEKGLQNEPLAFPVEPDQVLVRLQRKLSAAPEMTALARYCPLCPIPIRLGGTLLQMNLGRAYSGVCSDWSAAVPDLLRPSGPATLATPLALFLAPSRAKQPLWVAVVDGISYSFVFPEAGPRTGVIWGPNLHTDLGLQTVVRDQAWEDLKARLLELLSGLSDPFQSNPLE